MPTLRRPLRSWALALAGLAWAGPGWPLGESLSGQPPAAGIGGELDLVDQLGRPFSLARLSGRPALVFFGFTRCGSTCPVALLSARQVLAEFGSRPAPGIVFVTLDPVSDGPAQLREYLGHVDGRLIGLTGSPAQVSRVADRYGVGTRQAAPGAGVEHSSLWYLLDARGRVSRVYPHNETPQHLLADLRRLEEH